MYRGTHRTQYDGSALANQNCVPTTGANGARIVTEGRIDVSGAKVRSLVKREEETSPSTPGWSHTDLNLAMERLGVSFTIGSGGWDGVRIARERHEPVALSGDSDQFGGNTCSGAFDGNHQILIHGDDDGQGRWLIGDPICWGWRFEDEIVLRRYAEKYSASISYGVFVMPDWMQLSGGVESDTVITVTRDTPFKLGHSADAENAKISARVGRKYPLITYPASGWRGVGVTTPTVYSDGEPRFTLMFLPASVCRPERVPEEPSDCQEAVDNERNKWVAWHAQAPR